MLLVAVLFRLFDALYLVAQSCPTLCNSIECSQPSSSVHGDSPNKNTGVGCYALLQGIFPTQGLSPGLPHCRWICYRLSHQGTQWILEWVAYPFSWVSSLIQEVNQHLLHYRWLFTSWATREALRLFSPTKLVHDNVSVYNTFLKG